MVLLPLSERSNSRVQPCFDPISVQFGPNSTPVQITDGAAALGYLFSLVERLQMRTGCTIDCLCAFCSVDASTLHSSRIRTAWHTQSLVYQ
jgi:hypothetical protein